MQNVYKLASDLDKKLDTREDSALYKNFTITDADSELGDLRILIHKHGYRSFLETARETSAWEKISHLQNSLIRIQSDMEINMIYAALGILNDSEIAEWKAKLQ
jgi:hypothetical protein